MTQYMHIALAAAGRQSVPAGAKLLNATNGNPIAAPSGLPRAFPAA